MKLARWETARVTATWFSAIGGFRTVYQEFRRVTGDKVIIRLIRRIKNRIDRACRGFYRGRLPAIADAVTHRAHGR